jgi:predicted glutamine amidotransferase
MPVSEQNCHPFQWGRYLWMHNGVVGGFSKIKRRLLEQLSDAAYNSIQSFHSDSAVSFAVFLNHLPDLVQPQSPDVLVNAMQVKNSSSMAPAATHLAISLTPCSSTKPASASHCG